MSYPRGWAAQHLPQQLLCLQDRPTLRRHANTPLVMMYIVESLSGFQACVTQAFVVLPVRCG
jgi:hypothetical protein